jgi:hypothetical protein
MAINFISEKTGCTPLYQDYDYMMTGKVNDKFDIYSLGMHLYHMLYIVAGYFLNLRIIYIYIYLKIKKKRSIVLSLI